MSRLALLLLLASGVALAAYARVPQSSPAGDTFVIRGRVLASPSGDPVRGARITPKTSTSPSSVQIAAAPPQVLSNADGVFELTLSGRGPFAIVATKAGYSRAEVSVPAVAGSTSATVDIRMSKGAAISGVLLDEVGQPIANTGVMVEQVDPTSTKTARLTVATGQTDDLGNFRIGSLAAGRYLLYATPGMMVMMAEGRAVMTLSISGNNIGRTYYPGVPSADDAQPISLDAGEERAGVTLVAQSPSGVARRTSDAAALLRARTDPRRIATLRGRALTSDGKPVPGAVVQLASGDQLIESAAADPSGAYEIVVANPSPLGHSLTARRPGYEPAWFGQGRASPRGERIRIAAGETKEHLDITLRKLGTISGRILDEFGDPVEGAVVRALDVRYVDGRRQLVRADTVIFSRTSDLGAYRIYGLAPGRYTISASVGQILATEIAASLPGYGTTYYPGTASVAEMQRVALEPSQDVYDVDFALAHVKSLRVSGRATTSEGEPVRGGIALMPSYRSKAPTSMQMGARIEDGVFEFENVAPGDYVVQVSRGRNGNWNEGEFSYQYVTVTDADVKGLVLQTSPGSTITGRITFEGSDPLPPSGIELSPRPVDLDRSPQVGGPPARAKIQNDGTFELAGISGERRLQVLNAPQGWALKAVLVNGVDVTDAPLPFGRANQSLRDVEVVLSKQMSHVSGRVADVTGTPPQNGAVILAAASRELWYPDSRFLRRVQTASDGAFSIEGVPPGDYFALAVEWSSGPDRSDDWQDPDVLDALIPRATRVRVAEGEHPSLALRPIAR